MSNQFIFSNQNTTQNIDADGGGLALYPGREIVTSGTNSIQTNGFLNTTILVSGFVLTDRTGIEAGNGPGTVDTTSITVSSSGVVESFSENTNQAAIAMRGEGLSLQNAGSITGRLGVFADGEADVVNTGTITGTASVSAGIVFTDTNDGNALSSLLNSGTISSNGGAGVATSDVSTDLVNTGLIMSSNGEGLRFNNVNGNTSLFQSITNEGQIIGNGQYGIAMRTEGRIVNSGLIEGQQTGLDLVNTDGETEALITVSNLAGGSIIGRSDLGSGIFATGYDLILDSAGTISGETTGVLTVYDNSNQSGDLRFNNSGTVTGTLNGVEGQVGAFGDIENSGLITGLDGNGIFFSGGDGTQDSNVGVINYQGGVISGFGEFGVGVGTDGYGFTTVINEGEILGASVAVIAVDDSSVFDGDEELFVSNSGLIRGGEVAIAAETSLTVQNSGEITSLDFGAINAGGGNGFNDIGVLNTETGFISALGDGANTIESNGYDVTVINHGEMLGDRNVVDAGFFDDFGIAGTVLADVTNTGSMIAGNRAVSITGEGNVFNSGFMSSFGDSVIGFFGSEDPANRIQTATFSNSGTIAAEGEKEFGENIADPTGPEILLRQSGDGVTIRGLSLQGENTGQILANDTGVAFDADGPLGRAPVEMDFTNAGTITAGNSGIEARDAVQATILNTGETIATGDTFAPEFVDEAISPTGRAIQLRSVEVATVTNTGTVSGQTHGVFLRNDDAANSMFTAVVNSGVISAGGNVDPNREDVDLDSRAISAEGVDLNVTNSGSGEIIADEFGILAVNRTSGEFTTDAEVRITNDGAVAGGEGGIFLRTVDNKIVNNGTISGNSAGGITNWADSSGDFTTEISNTGTITGGNVGSSTGGAITMADVSLVLTNSGTISGNGETAVQVTAGGVSNGVDNTSSALSLFNTGTISGNTTSVLAGDAGNLVDNGGVLLGRVLLGGGFDNVFNSGVVQGNVLVGGGADDVVNTGTVIGDIDLNDGADTYDAAFTGTVSGSVFGGNGTDTMRGGQSTDRFVGGAAADMLGGRGGDDILDGGSGSDTLDGGAGDDTLTGGTDNDTLKGGAGDDDLQGGDGFDTLRGGTGDDMLDGGTQDDTLFGDDGNDTLNGGNGKDVMSGGDGNDTLNGGGGGDTMDGGQGDDTLNGGDGFDVLTGGAGDDALNGDEGDDTLDGGTGNDVLKGGVGGDTLLGGAGDDELNGENSIDTLNGGAGSDVLIGGGGADTFVFERGNALDTITDFADGTDRIDVSDWGLVDYADLEANYSVTEFGFGVQIAFANDDRLVIENIAQADLSDADFIFV